MFQQVYFHKASRASEHLLSRILLRVTHLLREGHEVPGTPPAIADVATGGDTFSSATSSWTIRACGPRYLTIAESTDRILADPTGRLFTRKLLKTVDLYGRGCESQRTGALPRTSH